jgi:VWFA-related protein
MKGFWTAVFAVAGAAVIGAQTSTSTDPQQPLFRVQIELVTTDAIVRDANGQFVPDLTKDEFEVYEDGVKQDLSSMTLVHGGRVTNLLLPQPPAVEGLILPAVRPRDTTSGRVLLFVVDDLHLDVHKTPVIRDLFDRIAKNLLHEGDLFGMISTGTSSIAVDLTYDRRRFDEAVKRIQGNALSPADIIQGQQGSQGPIELQHRAHLAFSTINDMLENLDKIHDRRKTVVYVSNGYDFVPFQQARYGTDGNSPFQSNAVQRVLNDDTARQTFANGNQQLPRQDPNNVAPVTEEFADAQLAQQLERMTQTANRVNATIFTIDPRGVVAAGDIAENVDPREWQLYVGKTQDTLRVIASETGGVAIVNQNEFDGALKRIDAEASDYYMLGYYAKDLDASRREHHIEVQVKRSGLTVAARKVYVAKMPTTVTTGNPASSSVK